MEHHTNGATEVTEQFIVEFDYRSDNGPRQVGPFNSREDARLYVQRIAHIGFEAEWNVSPLHPPA
jgi:hypothetical protein